MEKHCWHNVQPSLIKNHFLWLNLLSGKMKCFRMIDYLGIQYRLFTICVYVKKCIFIYYLQFIWLQLFAKNIKHLLIISFQFKPMKWTILFFCRHVMKYIWSRGFQYYENVIDAIWTFHWSWLTDKSLGDQLHHWGKWIPLHFSQIIIIFLRFSFDCNGTHPQYQVLYLGEPICTNASQRSEDQGYRKGRPNISKVLTISISLIAQ